MIKYHPLILILLLLFQDSNAQFPGIDTLFRADEIIYFSDLERNSFRDFLNGNPDYLAMISAINPGTDERELKLYRNWLDEIIEEIQNKKFPRLSEEKRIEHIKKYVSKSLLLVYKHEADFDDLFTSGRYNYFTAAALYAFILEKLNIPFEIYELPTQLFLVAYPEDQSIRVETTQPGHQYFMFDHQTRTDFVEFMHRQGVIDDITYRSYSTRDLFQQYYFADQGLSTREMIGMLYINSAIKLMVAQRTQDSYSQLEKAFILYPSYKSQYMLLAQLDSYLNKMDPHNLIDLGYLIKASRLIHYGVTRQFLDDYLLSIVNQVLVEEEDQDGFEYIYEYLQKYIVDKELKNNFTFYSMYENGRMEFRNTNYARALDYLEPAYEMRPRHKATEDLLIRSLGGYTLMVSPGMVLEKIQRFDSAYATLEDEGIYLMVKIQTYLSLLGESFQLQDGKNGSLYMYEFEKLMDTNPDADADHIQVGKSYSSAAIYYYRNGQIKKSREVLEKGLSYAPDNIELKLKLSSFK